MRQIKAIALACALFGRAEEGWATAPQPPSQAAKYSLVFFENFVNLNLSPTSSGQYIWFKDLWWETAPETFNAAVASSVLDLKWSKGQNPPETTISSCSPDGLNCRAFRYGYFEARMKWDVSTGAWPAFWLIPVEGIWGAAETGELDVFDGQGDPADAHTYFGTIHDWLTTNGTTVQLASNDGHNYYLASGVDFSQWHNYGVLWVPGYVTWYLDNNPILTAPTYPVFDKQRYFIVLSAQEGVNWTAGDTTGVTAAALNLYVDWVKVWQNLP
jgi:glycosyl hydrolase family 16